MKMSERQANKTTTNEWTTEKKNTATPNRIHRVLSESYECVHKITECLTAMQTNLTGGKTVIVICGSIWSNGSQWLSIRWFRFVHVHRHTHTRSHWLMQREKGRERERGPKLARNLRSTPLHYTELKILIACNFRCNAVFALCSRVPHPTTPVRRGHVHIAHISTTVHCVLHFRFEFEMFRFHGRDKELHRIIHSHMHEDERWVFGSVCAAWFIRNHPADPISNITREATTATIARKCQLFHYFSFMCVCVCVPSGLSSSWIELIVFGGFYN